MLLSSFSKPDTGKRGSPTGALRSGWARLFLLSIVTGAFTGGLVAVFRLAVTAGEVFRDQVWLHIVTSAGSWVWAPLVIVVLAALGGVVTRLVPVTVGGGVAPIQTALTTHDQIRWWPELPAKFLASFFTLVSGLSLGREGPAVFLGGAVGQAVGSWFSADEGENCHLLACGVAAAVAAAFGAPLAGILFVWEELRYSSLQSFFVPAIAAVAVATKICAGVLGPGANFPLVQGPDLPIQALILFLFLGLSLGLLGLVYNHGLSYVNKFFRQLTWCPYWLRPALAAFPVAWAALLMGTDLLGSGQVLIIKSLVRPANVAAAAALLVVKLVLTMISAASGASGGVFLPLLSVGALMGSLWGQAATRVFTDLAFPPQFVAAGMAAAFGGMLGLPFTGLILVFEITGSYSYENLLYYLATVLIAHQVRESGENLLIKRQKPGASGI